MSAVLRLYVRLTRRGIILLAVAMVAYVVVEAVSFVQTYPDEASRLRLAQFGDQPAVRMLQGIPHAVETVGGFVVWDGGWFLQAVVGIWAVLTTSRLLRGEEDSGRAELVAAGTISGVGRTGAAVAVVGAGCLLAGLAVFGAILVPSEQLTGSALFAVGVFGFGLVMAAVTAVAAQLFGVRRRVAAVGAGVLGLAFVLRMIANSSDTRSWVSWLSPFGWMDRLRPFGDNNAPVLVAYVLVCGGLLAAAFALRSRRDLGSAFLAQSGAPRPRLLLLQSPIRFAWRLTWGVLLAWAVGIGLYAFMIGSLVKSMGDVLADDPAYEASLELLGITKETVYGGMVAVMAVVVGLIVSLYSAWRIGAVRNEEDGERAEHLLTRPLTRGRWLGGHLVLALVSVIALVVVNGTAMWLGATVTGADLSLADTLAASANLLPVILLFGALAVAMFGVAPRLTVGVPVGAAVVAYVLSLVGPALDLPGWLVGLSPFYHVALVPIADFAAVQAAVLMGLAVLALAVGWVGFGRRDIVGA